MVLRVMLMKGCHGFLGSILFLNWVTDSGLTCHELPVMKRMWKVSSMIVMASRTFIFQNESINFLVRSWYI